MGLEEDETDTDIRTGAEETKGGRDGRRYWSTIPQNKSGWLKTNKERRKW